MPKRKKPGAQARPQKRRSASPAKAASARARRARAETTPERRALDALAAMRHGKSLTRAAKAAHTTAATVKKYAAGAVVEQRDGRYSARPADRLVRHMRLLSPDGILAVPVRGSASASRIGRYWSAVNRFLRTGHTDRLREFQGAFVRVGRTRHPFITDPALLERLAYAGEVSFEDLYALTA